MDAAGGVEGAKDHDGRPGFTGNRAGDASWPQNVILREAEPSGDSLSIFKCFFSLESAENLSLYF
jgi:hypothetical protein